MRGQRADANQPPAIAKLGGPKAKSAMGNPVFPDLIDTARAVMGARSRRRARPKR